MPLPGLSRLVGDRPNEAWLLSGFGVFLRLVRFNWIQPRSYHAAFGLRFKAGDNLLRLLSDSENRLEKLSQIVEQPVQAAWSLRSWLPFQPGSVDVNHLLDALRFCPSCLRLGLHSHITQLPWIVHCPWHGDRLRSDCRVCGDALRTLVGPDQLLLQCTCGHDPINVNAAVQVRAWPNRARQSCIRTVWDSTQGERSSCALVGPTESIPKQALISLVKPPTGGHQRTAQDCEASAREVDRPWSTNDDPLAVVERFDQLRSPRPTVVDLPWSIAQRFRRIADAVVLQLPPGTLTSREREILQGGLTNGKIMGKCRIDVSILTLPRFAVGNAWYVDVSAISKRVVGVAYWLVQRAWKSETVGALRTREEAMLIVKAAIVLLERGYAEGIRAVLAKYVPTSLGRSYATHVSDAWALVREDAEGRIRSVRITWTRRPTD